MQKTYSLRALVLRRTKLGESDVICTLLCEDGSQVRAVAKGARKPTSTFASRLEVYAVCDLLLVHGKSLDLIKEARLVEAHSYLRSDIALMEAAAPMVELLDKATQVGLQDARLYVMTVKALTFLKDVDPDAFADLAKITCAHLLKTLAILGFRPSFDTCVICGSPYEATHVSESFSLIDGGVVCDLCCMQSETIMIQRETLWWSQAFLYSTFEDIVAMTPDIDTLYAVMRFLQLWIRQHLGINLKSLSYVIAF